MPGAWCLKVQPHKMTHKKNKNKNGPCGGCLLQGAVEAALLGRLKAFGVNRIVKPLVYRAAMESLLHYHV